LSLKRKKHHNILIFTNGLSGSSSFSFSFSSGCVSRSFSGSFDFLEFVSRLETNSSEVLEGILNNMRNCRGSEVSTFEGDSGNVEDTLSEVLENGFGVDGEDLAVEDITVVVVSNNGHTI